MAKIIDITDDVFSIQTDDQADAEIAVIEHLESCPPDSMSPADGEVVVKTIWKDGDTFKIRAYWQAVTK